MKLMMANRKALAWGPSARRLLTKVIFAISLLTTACPNYLAKAQDTAVGDIGSKDEYVHRQGPRSSYSIPELGIEVLDGTGQLDGALVRGAVVATVYPNGPAARAGLKDEKHGTQSALLGAFIVGSFFFPPAFIGAVAISESQIGASHDTIIAVDSERVQSVDQLENAIAAASTGQIIYLTVVRGGSRNQIRVFCSQVGAEAPPVVQLP